MPDSTLPASGPLAGLKVLDFTALLQGPLATQVLADLGADVVKLEKEDGEWMRNWGIFGARTHGETDAFLAFNRNKRSVTLDLRDAQTRDRVLELAARADVVVENFRPGVMDRLGLGYEALQARNPGIIYAASSGYGTTGPYVKRPGQDFLAQALSGAMWLSGRRGDPPMVLGLAATDQYTGIHLVVGILAALHHRNRTGDGQRIDLDLLSCVMALQQQEITVYLNHGLLPERAQENIGACGVTAPSGTYATRDGHLMLAMIPCPRLGEILGLDWLAEYDDLDKMYRHRDEVYRRLAPVFAGRSTDEWVEFLLEHDVWCAPVRNYGDLESDPQIRHKRLIWEVPYGDDGRTYRTVGSPFTFSATPVSLRRGAPRAGQHNEAFASGDLWPKEGAGENER
jgi:crotonobetainyl-CoA:carnitine CoA-transferase CaiB-like acyl-CoA transferase